MSLLLIAKFALAPSIVASGSMAGKRWGHQVGGLVAGFPNTSSPILFFLAIERGPAFASAAAVGTLMGLVALAAYGLAYVWAATRLPWWLALPVGWAAFLGVAWACRKAEPSLLLATTAAVGSLALSLKLMPRLLQPGGVPPPHTRRRDLPFRMAAAVALLVGVTALAGWLGPALAGVLSAFPIASSVLTAAAHREAGPAGAKWVLMGIFTALMALIAFTAALPLLLAQMHLAQAFAVATALGFGLQALLLWQRQRLALHLTAF
jgi:hypothetical protein